MTCIVGVRSPSGVVIGGDSAGVAGWQVHARRDPKVFRVGEFVMGFTDSFRMGQLLAYRFSPPPPFEDLFRYMATDFIDALRATLRSGGYATTTNGKEEGGTFLVGVRNRLFRVCGDFQVAENLCDFDAVGCGAEIALGALYASRRLKPEDRVTLALTAAEDLNGGVRSPFNLVSV